jgi:hypothetical protein
MKMEAVSYSETSATLSTSTRRRYKSRTNIKHVPAENLKSLIINIIDEIK